MAKPDPVLHLPKWVESPSGLFLPSSVAGAPEAVALPDELRPKPALTAVVNEMPSSYDQMWAYIDEGSLGLEVSTQDSQISRVEALPFEATAIVLSRVATHADHARNTPEHELELARALYGDTGVWPKLEALARNSGMKPFAEQHFVALMRMLVLHGREVETLAPALTFREWILLARSTVAMGSVVDTEVGSDRDPGGWLAYLVQNGAYYQHEPAFEAMSRIWTIFGEIPQSSEMSNHRDAVPIDEWLVEQTGMTLTEQLAIGLGVLGMSHALDDELEIGARGPISGQRLHALAEEAGISPERVEAALTADRAWYCAQFSKTSSAGAGWDRVPFEQRPLLRLSDGRLNLWHPRFMLSWVTEGIHYRLLDAARKHQQVKRYTRFLGALTEEYALRLMKEAHSGPRRMGAGVVQGEAPYGGRRGRERRTPDIAIHWGEDLVLIEVGSRRLTLESRRGGDPAKVQRDLDLMIGEKLEQLGDRVADLLDPRSGAAIPGVDMRTVKRIWPILVSGAGFLQSELLWDYADEHTGRLRSLAKVQPVTLMDLSDLELLAGLLESGHTVVELLAAKTQSPYARIDFRRFANEALHLPDTPRATGVSNRWHQAMDACAGRLGFTDEQIARMRAA